MRTTVVTLVSTLLALSVTALMMIAIVQALGASEVVESNAFRSKASIFYALLASGGALVGFRSRREGMDYFLAGELYENQVIRSNNKSLRLIRQASWSTRASRASTYSSISLGLILLVALLFIASRDDVHEQRVEALFVWVILISSVSVILYGISLQLWDEALGAGYGIEEVIELRTGALILSSLGWIMLISALGLAVITVHSPLGTVVGAVGVFAGLYVFEHKWRLAHRQQDPDLKGGPKPYLKRLKSGKPVLGANVRPRDV